MIVSITLIEDVKRIQVWKSENEGVGFLLHPKFVFFFFFFFFFFFSQNLHFCTFLLILFMTNYCLVIQKVQSFKIVILFKFYKFI